MKKLLLQGLINKMAHLAADFLTAVRFLTIIPVGLGSGDDEPSFQTSLYWFPLVGLLLGAVIAGIIQVLGLFVPVSVLAILSVVLSAGLTGCLHLDGLADSGDGLLSARPKERALEIMRDSRIGAMGVIALILVLLSRYASLATVPLSAMVAAVLLMPVAGRTAILLSMSVLPYARTEGGLGGLFYSSNSRKAAAVGLIFCIVTGLLVSWQISLLVLCTTLVTVAVFSFWCFKKLGGATGDTLGAVCELTECAVALSLSIFFFTG